MITNTITFLFKMLLVISSGGITAVMLTSAMQGGVSWAVAVATGAISMGILCDVAREDAS